MLQGTYDYPANLQSHSSLSSPTLRKTYCQHDPMHNNSHMFNRCYHIFDFDDIVLLKSISIVCTVEPFEVIGVIFYLLTRYINKWINNTNTEKSINQPNNDRIFSSQTLIFIRICLFPLYWIPLESTILYETGWWNWNWFLWTSNKTLSSCLLYVVKF